ncbi:MAG TPA: glycosyltransferase family A protein [Stellaceae bacterium]|nr:glycosyltransferase family A protein [Stellaceae bacterium]
MTGLPVAAALIFAGAIVLALRHIVQQFCRYRGLDARRGPLAPASSLPSVAIVVPARNERDNIEPCLRGLVAQLYPAEKLRIIAVDDGSSDGTAERIRGLAAATGRIELIEAGELPPGWAGKPHACWLGARAAAAEWLCFIDADTVAEPLLIQSAVCAAECRGLDLVSLEPFQELSGFLDRLMLPLGFMALAATQKLERLAINGQFILMRAESYFRVGGHAANPGAICEDQALAAAARRGGYRIAVLGGESLVRTRMYRDTASLWEGLSKNLTEMFGGAARTIAIALGTMAIAWCAVLLPLHAIVALIHDRHPWTIAEAALAVPSALVVFALQVALARHFRIPFWYGLLLPLGGTIGALIAASAMLCKWRGRVSWKGRVYSA